MIPLIHRQRALSRIGEIRIGDEKQDGKVGRKLDTFRLTSQHKEIVERAADLYGGAVKAWDSPAGAAWQVVTQRSALPVFVVAGYSLQRYYELWEGASKRTRRCDGEEEFLSGQPCLCNASGKDECRITTRLMVVLPETGTSLGWQLSSRGETAANELDGAMRIAEGIAHGRTFIPAQLRLTQRRGQLPTGGATRFVVPVLDFNPQQTAALPTVEGELPALPSGYKPIEQQGNGVSLEAGLAATEKTTPRISGGRQTAPIPEVDDIPFGDGPVPVPDESGAATASSTSQPGQTATGNEDAAPAAPAVGAPHPPQTAGADKPPTKAQLTKLGVLVGNLRDKAELLSTEQLYAGVARNRNVDVTVMIDLLPDAYDNQGVLHFGPLMATLTRPEASQLIDQLEAYEAKAAA